MGTTIFPGDSGTLIKCCNHLNALPNGTIVFNYSNINEGDKIFFRKCGKHFRYSNEKGEEPAPQFMGMDLKAEMLWLPAWVL